MKQAPQFTQRAAYAGVWNRGSQGFVIIEGMRHPAVKFSDGSVAVLRHGTWFDQDALYRLGIESTRFMMDRQQQAA